MAKALFFSLPASGHVHPSLPLMSELVRRGEQVVYYATEAFRQKVERTGATFCAYDNAFLSDLRVLPGLLPELSWLMARTTREVLSRHLREFREFGPDYVMADSVAPWGRWVSEILDVPSVTSVSTMAFNRHVFSFAAKHGVQPKSARATLTKMGAVAKALMMGRRLRKEYGVAGPGMMSWVSGTSKLNIVYTSRMFQPREETFDARFVFVGPAMADRGDSDGAAWGDSGRLVYVSMGTLFNTDLSFYRTCFEAFEGEDFQVVLSAGSLATVDQLGLAPANFVVRAHVPQLEVLEKASVFVTHGGMNSVSESLYYGVPMVAIPQMSEQEIVSRRVEELGAGMFLDKRTVTAARLRECVRSVADTPSYRAAAQRVRESFLSAGGVERAADAIFAYTGR